MAHYRSIILIGLFLFIVTSARSQVQCLFEHYSTDDGLPQYTINDILQDKKGYIWLATFDGLSKFDGYTFHNFKSKTSDRVLMKSNRIDRLHEDRSGRIWMEVYGMEAYCFDPKTETFWGLSLLGPSCPDPFAVSQIQVKPSGRVWILSEQQGCLMISDSVFHAEFFNTTLNNLPGNNVFSVFEDQNQNSWLLTDNGLVLLPADHPEKAQRFFVSDGSVSGQKLGFKAACEVEDEIWFGGSNGLIAKYSKQTNSFRTHQLGISSAVRSIEKLNDQSLLIVSEQDGFFEFNLYSGETICYNSTTVKGMKTSYLVPIRVVLPDQFWYVADNELGIWLYDFNKHTNTFFRVETHDPTMSAYPAKAFVLNDKTGALWIQPYGGGFSKYNRALNRLEPFFNEPTSPNWKFSNILHSVLFDRQGNLWFCSKSHGLEKIIFKKNAFNTLQVSDLSQSTANKDVRAIFEDQNQTIWIATKENKIVLIDRSGRELGCLSPEGKLKTNAIWTNTPYTIKQDSQGRIWIGTRGDGLYRLHPKAEKYTFLVSHFTETASDPFSLGGNDVYAIHEDENHQIWIGTFGGGLNLIDEQADGSIRFINSKNKLVNFPMGSCRKVRCLAEDQRGHLYVGTTGGLLVFRPQPGQPDKNVFRHYERILHDSSGLNSNDVLDLCLTRKGELFVGSSGGGINKMVSVDSEGFPLQFKAYTRNDGLPADNIQAILEDRDGKLWLSSETDLTRFDPQKEFFEVFSEVKWMMRGKNFSEATKLSLSSGEIFFGYSEGILRFFPDQIKSKTYVPYLAFTNLFLFNRKVGIGEGSPLISALDDSREVVLTHKQNYFAINFAALDYENSLTIKYAYKLEGFDQEWNYVQNQRSASYTNLPKGSYLFKVKSTNSEGIWCENERILPIIMKPSFWETPLAYTLYFVLFALIIILIDYNLLIIYRLKTNIRLEKRMSDLKLKFFTDISHEIRTPLTMITSPVDYLMNDSETPEKIKKQLSLISHSTQRMLRLVNQILDLRKLQDQPLNFAEVDLAKQLEDLCADFQDNAENQNINFRFNNLAGQVRIWADKEAIDKIAMNLLSNAFKYSPPGQSVTVSLLRDDKYIVLKVADTGQGIPKEKHKNLFVRFASFNNNPEKPGTGIGLSIVKELADKLSARITVESEPGKGTCFTLYFPSEANQMLMPVRTIQADLPVKEPERSAKNRLVKESEKKVSPKEKPKVLIVEDDENLRMFICSILENDYHLFEAGNGVKGLEMALEFEPDFVISDIMMPEMDGIQLLKELRKNIKTSHIPIILLTAKTTIESQIEGITHGADDYITKPFSVPYFKARIENLLLQHRRLQKIFSDNLTSGIREFDPKPFQISPQDGDLMERVLACIEQNIDNGEFTVDELSAMMNLGRTTFFNKIKGLTGLPPVEFIRDIRIKRAAQLLSNSDFLIKEVAFMNGFSDTKYFGKCFKEKFGVTPLEFKKKSK